MKYRSSIVLLAAASLVAPATFAQDCGWYARGRDVPLMIEALPHGFEVGYRHTF